MQPELPRVALWISRASLAVVALLVLAMVVGGVAMQIELWSPGPQWSAERYQSMLGLHALAVVAASAPALAGCFGYVLVSRLVGAQRIVAPAFAWIAFGLWVIGIGAAAYIVGRGEDTGWTLYTPYYEPRSKLPETVMLFAFALAGTLYAVHLGAIVVRALRDGASAGHAIAATFAGAIGIAGFASLLDAFGFVSTIPGEVVIFGAPTAFVSPWVGITTRTAAVVLATAALVGERGRTRSWVALGCCVAWGVLGWTLLGLAVAGLWIALAIANGFRRPCVAFVVFGCAPALVLLSLSILLGRNDAIHAHLHDTHFEVGAQHLAGATTVFAGLAALHAWARELFGRVPHAPIAWTGACTASAGMLLQAVGSLRLGANGMPRRYWDYDPTFVNGHLLTAAGAGFFIVGLAIVAVAWLRPKSV